MCQGCESFGQLCLLHSLSAHKPYFHLSHSQPLQLTIADSSSSQMLSRRAASSLAPSELTPQDVYPLLRRSRGGNEQLFARHTTRRLPAARNSASRAHQETKMCLRSALHRSVRCMAYIHTRYSQGTAPCVLGLIQLTASFEECVTQARGTRARLTSTAPNGTHYRQAQNEPYSQFLLFLPFDIY